MVGQEVVFTPAMHTQNILHLQWSIHDPINGIWYGDLSNTRCAERMGPDLTTRSIVNLVDRRERVWLAADINKLHEDIREVLWFIDQVYDKRYLWISTRTNAVSGTLKKIQIFDTERSDREQETLDQILRKAGLEVD